MKALLLALLIGVAGYAYFRVKSDSENVKTRRHAEAMLAEMRDVPAASPTPATVGRTITYVPGLHQYVEHDANVSAMQSLGGGGGGGGRSSNPTPYPQQQVISGWTSKGTSLNKPAHP